MKQVTIGHQRMDIFNEMEGIICIKQSANGWAIRLPAELVPFQGFKGPAFMDEDMPGLAPKSKLQKDRSTYYFPKFDDAIAFIRTNVNVEAEATSLLEYKILVGIELHDLITHLIRLSNKIEMHKYIPDFPKLTVDLIMDRLGELPREFKLNISEWLKDPENIKYIDDAIPMLKEQFIKRLEKVDRQTKPAGRVRKPVAKKASATNIKT